ncbi:hypothetical protein CALVIDRAFT_320433 [Calocera viscosa TUFC12733]|uniref:GAR domain-containing protein n=1 Tax=Calocera viscosa (strain TUFC12733) TaxID=1330018 RepID=A0A167QLM7_CALVF|nr:hypothetical protein CALVIDRAFT_320433 [Calocera viscosa TUFC12733]
MATMEERSQEELDAGTAPAVPLDTLDVVELQAFNDRKAWIIEKTKYLESLTPLEPLRTESDVYVDRTTGLPTLDEIRSWVRELRALEKETDQFDKVDLKRLRRTARAAANRHLTPEDTDLVDLTLSTLLALDHLLEAIQARSEQLDLFGHRVRWEDQRTECEQERLTLLSDLNTFISGPARWSPTAYEEASASGTFVLPDQVASMPAAVQARAGTPAFSQSSSSRSTPTMAFPTSRSQRFHLGQSLAADASRLYMRATNLREGRVEVAGKLLDRVISLKKVPDQFLDEQDRLENDTEYLRRSLGEFSLALAEQWIVADRVYSDCVKHQSEAHALMADLGKAAMKPPNQRLHASLAYRISTLESRLSTAAYDVLIFRYIPQPTHPSYPEQEHFNEQIAQKLSEELETARNLGRIAGNHVKEYHNSLKVLHRADKIKEEMGARQSQLSELVVRLARGNDALGDAGAAPDLSTEACLEPGRHSAYMAALPALLDQVDEAGRSADRLVRTARAHLPALKAISLNPGYLENCIQAINSLDAERNSLAGAKASASSLCARFTTTCQVWSETQGLQQSCHKHQADIQNGLECDRWRPESPVSSGSGPPTPNTPSNRSFMDSSSPSEVMAQLDTFAKYFKQAVETLLKEVIPRVGPALQAHFNGASERLEVDISNLRQLAKLWQRVRAQATAMKGTMDEAYALENRLSSILLEADVIWQPIPGSSSIPELASSIQSLRHRHSEVRQEIAAFSGGLVSRIPFVTSHIRAASSTYKVRSPKPSAILPMPQTPPEAFVDSSLTIPFDPTALDEAIRSQVNVRSARLNGALYNVDRRLRLLEGAERVRSFDECLAQAVRSVEDVYQSLDARSAAIRVLASQEAAESIADVQLALEALDSETTQLLSFASSMDHMLQNIITLPQQAYENIRRDILDQDTEELGALLDSRQSHLRGLETREDQLREDTAKALRRLHDISSALAKRLSTLEREKAERDAVLRRQQLEAEEQARKRREEEMRVVEPNLTGANSSSEQDIISINPANSVVLTLRETDLIVVVPDIVSPNNAPIPQEASEHAEGPDTPPQKRILSGTDAQDGGVRLSSQPSTPAILVPSVIVTDYPQSEVIAHWNELKSPAPSLAGSQRNAAVPSKPVPSATMTASPPSSTLATSVAENSVGAEGAPDFDVSQDDEDVFGSFVSIASRKSEQAIPPLQALTELRAALLALKIEDLAQSSSPETQFGILPTQSIVQLLNTQVTGLLVQVQQVEIAESDARCVCSRDALQQELNSALDLFPRLHSLATFAGKVDECDAGINEIISQVDDYPGLSQSGTRPSSPSFEAARTQLRQLIERVSGVVDTVVEHADGLADDFRVLNERTRIEQTWAEARDEANDRLDPLFVRTISTLSLSSLSSSTSSRHLSTQAFKKSSLSRQSSTSMLSGRSSVLSASTSGSPWTSSPGFKPTSRSVSGPLPRTPASRLPRLSQSPTPSEVLRQRTESVTSMYSQRPRQSLDSFAPVWSRGISDARRRKSSISSETTPSRPRNISMSSSWSRTPRQSFGSPMLPAREAPKKRQYVANPKNKLDVAVGNVINRLPVNVSVRPLPGWRDQSGRYYIGDGHPKPYFCRILRSQTVMVRVGGGWMELSKFIKSHFADLFRILPPGPLTPPMQAKEPWINSATLLKAAGSPLQAAGSPLASPSALSPTFSDAKTPSPAAHAGDMSTSSVFSFTSSSPGSPLASIQFLRKADDLRRSTQSPPLRGSTSKPAKAQGKATPRTPVWRP